MRSTVVKHEVRSKRMGDEMRTAARVAHGVKSVLCKFKPKGNWHVLFSCTCPDQLTTVAEVIADLDGSMGNEPWGTHD